jgi:hypothetical protein
MGHHPSTCLTLRTMVARMLNLRLLPLPAGALAGPIGPATLVAPSQSLRSLMKVEAMQVSTAAQLHTEMTQKAGEGWREERKAGQS